MIFASALTPAAQHWLAATTSARVLSVHERACNLINQNNDLLAILASARGLNPFALVADIPFAALSLADKIEISEGRLVIRTSRKHAKRERRRTLFVRRSRRMRLVARRPVFPCGTHPSTVFRQERETPLRVLALFCEPPVMGRLVIDAARAARWNPAPDWEAVRTARMDWAALLLHALELAPEGSLLNLYFPSARAAFMDGCHAEARRAEASPLTAQTLRFAQGDNLGTRAQVGAKLLVEGLFSNSQTLCLDGVHALAGLGGGLTPAGDDFIVGALLGVWAGCYGPAALDLCAPIAEAAAERTTFLSAAYLRAAARGECMMQWHRVLRAETAVAQKIEIGELLKVGHTSGADALAGFLAARCLREPRLAERDADGQTTVAHPA